MATSTYQKQVPEADAKTPEAKQLQCFFVKSVKYIFALRLRKTAFTNSIPNEHDFTHKKKQLHSEI